MPNNNSMRARVAKKTSVKKSAPTPPVEEMPNKYPKPGTKEFGIGVRSVVREAITAIAHRLDSNIDMDHLHALIHARVSCSYNNPNFAALAVQSDTSQFYWRSERLYRKNEVRKAGMRFADFLSISSMAIFSDVEVTPEEVCPTLPLNLREGRFPSGRYMFFAAHHLFSHFCSADPGFDGEEVFLSGEMTHSGTLAEYVTDSEIIPALDLDGWREALNGNNWDGGQLGANIRQRRHTHMTTLDRDDTDVHRYVDFTLHQIQGPRPDYVSVEELLAGPETIGRRLRETINGIGYAADRSNGPEYEEPFSNLQISIIANILIEGLHFNTHRRPEIEHLIVGLKEPMTRGELVSKKISGALKLPLAFRNTDADIIFDLPFTYHSFDKSVEGVRVGDCIYAGHLAEAGLLFLELAEAYTPDKDMIRKSAIRAATLRYEKEYQSALNLLDDARRRVIEMENRAAETHFTLSTFRDSVTEHLEVLEKQLSEMAIITKVQLNPDFSIVVETAPIYAEAVFGSGSSQYKIELPSDMKRRYMGVYQIEIHILTGYMRARNIKAPYAVSNPEGNEESFRSRHDNVIWAFPVFHPHCSRTGSGKDRTANVCLGGYSNQIAISSKREQYNRVEITMTRIRSLLTFLQEFTITDMYVTALMHVFREDAPTLTAITPWQDIVKNTNHRANNNRGLGPVFGIDERFESQAIPVYEGSIHYPTFNTLEQFLDKNPSYDENGHDHTADDTVRADEIESKVKLEIPKDVVRYEPAYLNVETLTPRTKEILPPLVQRLKGVPEDSRVQTMAALRSIHTKS